MSRAVKHTVYLGVVFIVFFLMVAGFRNWRSIGQIFAGRQGNPDKIIPETEESFTPGRKAALQLGDMEILSRMNQEYAKLTKAVIPSVVSINTTGVRRERMINLWGGSRIRENPTQGQGSGVIVSEQGHIITNHHVIAGQQQIRVTLHDGRTYTAELVGEDTLLDIAVIRIDSEERFVALKLGDSSAVEVGQIVFAIGNPFGLGETVTQGIISAKERSLSENQRDLFQTDAAINPGNSGGPLVNLMGEIIGINVGIPRVDRETSTFLGVGFSIPSNEVKEALMQIIERGRPIRGYLGVQMRDLDEVLSTELGYDQNTGSVVIGTAPESPAAKAGLAPQDVIQTYGGVKISSTPQLIALVQRTPTESSVEMGIWRNGKSLNLTTKITEATSPPVYQEIPTVTPTAEDLETLRRTGLEVRDLSTDELSRGYSGVVVSKIPGSGPVYETIKPRDLILRVNGQSVVRASDFYLKLARSISSQNTSLSLIRQGLPLNIQIPRLGE